MRTIYSRCFFILCMTFLTTTHCLNSQPGENIWHLAAQIGTQLDILSSCMATPLSGSPIIISQPGVYCLSSDLSANNITITSSDVSLDLKGHTISNLGSSMAISIADNLSRITIQNGFIDGSEEGVSLGLDNTDITIKNIRITNCNKGVRCNSSAQVVIDSIEVFRFIDYGVVLFECANVLVTNCITTQDSLTGIGKGFFVSNLARLGTGIVIDNCQSNKTQWGFSVDYVSTLTLDCAVSIINCTSQDSTSYGFDFASSQINHALVCKNCTALACNLAGFNIECFGGFFENCVAQSNNINGFTCDNNVTTPQNCILKNCQAINNGSIGFNFASANSGNIIQNCTASNNATGFSGNSGSPSNVIFFFNTATSNMIDFTALGTYSGPIGLISSSKPFFGGNLHGS